ncbi:MAG TPA: alcohol dehydrogenase, partial [Acidimicrobiaceae bacterium]|nr:alcohol dehydrogenase [Acidimicrobiaceae bacterium]
MTVFRALRLDKSDGEFRREYVELDDGDLPSVGDADQPEVIVDVEYSTVNFKDALAVADQSPIVRSWPMVPGIDLAGTVASSDDPEVPVGQRVVVNGWGIGEESWGGMAQRARIR